MGRNDIKNIASSFIFKNPQKLYIKVVKFDTLTVTNYT